jgi:hypothetical protein
VADARDRRIRDPDVGGLVQSPPAARTDRVCSAGRVRSTLLCAGCRRLTHITRSPMIPVRFTLIVVTVATPVISRRQNLKVTSRRVDRVRNELWLTPGSHERDDSRPRQSHTIRFSEIRGRLQGCRNRRASPSAGASSIHASRSPTAETRSIGSAAGCYYRTADHDWPILEPRWCA